MLLAKPQDMEPSSHIEKKKQHIVISVSIFVFFHWCFALPIYVMVAFTTSLEVPEITNYIMACRKTGGGRSVNIIFRM